MSGLTHCERVLNLLSDGEPHSHHQIYALFVVGHSRISELRKKGYRIEQWREGDTYFYQLIGALTERGVYTPDRSDESESSLVRVGEVRHSPRSVNASSARGLDDGHLCLSPGTPPVPVIEAVCDDSGQLVLGGVA